jgi:uncharacterized protein (DUF362 family)
MSKSNKVSIVKSSYDTVNENLSKAISLAGGFANNNKNKKRVIIKINLCDARTADTGTITHPVFLDALLRCIRKDIGDIDIFVAESDGRVVLADYYAKWFGIMPIIEKWGAHWVNLSKEKCAEKKAPFWPEVSLSIPEIFENSYFITLPKLKTNTLTKITCCLKNQYGCNPALDKQIFHSHIDEAITALNWAVGVPDFCIVDGIIGEGGIWGPSFGVPIQSEVIVAGRDEVAVDCVCARIMGFNPRSIKHIKLAAKRGLGSMNYNTVGESLDSVKADFKWSGMNQRLFMLAQRFRDREFKRMRSA